MKIRCGLIGLWMLFGSATSALAQVSIGINLRLYPELVQVPGYPVYYAPQLDSNYFFYDGMYWVYQGDNWYASSWYNGPWGFVGPEVVPLFVLRIPVRYYRAPPPYFRGWRSDASPHWGEHWGNGWERRRSGWDKWDRKVVRAPAPLPVYQRQYSGDRYPRVEQQRAIHSQNYSYQPRSAVVRERHQEQTLKSAPVSSQRDWQGKPRDENPSPPERRGPNPPPRPQQGGAGVPPSQPQTRGKEVQRPEPSQRTVQREQPAQKPNQENAPQARGASQEPRREQGQERGRERGEERGQERNR